MKVETSPKISVVIFSYNFEKYIGECIESILAQTLLPYEIIICDDHSLDDSWTIISEYSERYPELIKAYRHEKNMGSGPNGNFGRKMARGDLYTYIDGDDRFLPRKLELEWKALQENPEAKIAYSSVTCIDADGNTTGVTIDFKGYAPPTGDVFVKVFCIGFLRNHLVYRSCLEEVGFPEIDKNVYFFHDIDEIIRLTAKYQVAYSGEILFEYRRHPQGISQRGERSYLRKNKTYDYIRIYGMNLPLINSRSPMDATQIKFCFEYIIVKYQKNLNLSDRNSYYSPRIVYDRYRMLLKELKKPDCDLELKKRLFTIFELLAMYAIEEEIERGNRTIALKYVMEILPQYPNKSLFIKLAAKSLLPNWAYNWLSHNK